MKHDVTRWEVKQLTNHLDGMRLSKKDYSDIARIAEKIGQKKHRGIVFRGYQMLPKDIPALLSDKPLKLSTSEGGFKDAESWTKDLKVAVRIAYSLKRPYVVMKSKPAPKDIIISIDSTLVEKLRDLGFCDDELSDLDHYVNWEREEEVLIATGNRKYTLCRNVVEVGIPHVHALANKKKLEKLLTASKKNFDIFAGHLASRKKDNYNFACAGGKLVYLPSMDAHYKWSEKTGRLAKN